MKKPFLFVALLGFVAMFFSCAAVNEKTLKESGAKFLNQQDLIEFFKVERIGDLRDRQGRTAEIHYFPNGTRKLKYKGGGDEGPYRIEKNGQFCSKWKKLRDGAEKCYRMYRTGENKIVAVNIDGSFNTEVVFKK
jgi:hypothetical protein